MGFGLIFIFSISVFSVNTFANSEFQLGKLEIKSIKCDFKDKAILFEGVANKYKVSENGKISKVENCQKINSQKQIFISFEYITEIHTGNVAMKVLSYEVAQIDSTGKSLKSVRTETIDQVNLSGDLANYSFEKSYKTFWGQSAKDQSPMIKIEVTYKDGSYTTYLKLDPKKQLFIDMI